MLGCELWLLDILYSRGLNPIEQVVSEYLKTTTPTLTAPRPTRFCPPPAASTYASLLVESLRQALSRRLLTGVAG